METNKSGITPCGHYVLVKQDIIEEKTKGGIILAPQSREQEQRAATKGVLIAIGPTAWQEFAEGEAWAKIGDYVSFAKFAGIEMDGADGEKYMLLNDADALAVLNSTNS